MELLVIAILFVVFVVPLWALVRTFRLKRDAATRQEVARLTDRVYSLEKQALELQKAVGEARLAGVAATPKPEPFPAGPGAPVQPPPVTERRPAPPPAVAPPATAHPPEKPAAPAPPAPPRPEIPPPPAIPPPPIVPPQKSVPPPISEIPPAKAVPPSPPPEPKPPAPVAKPAALPQSIRPRAAKPVTAPLPAAPKGNWMDLEETLGTNWLNKIGISALVIGLGLLLNYFVPQLGKGGKIALAYGLSAALLGLGVRGERSERYRNLARVILGGGWAATYGTTYALHNASAVRVVESAAVGFLLLFIVAAGILLHSLRFNSQVVTGFAYVLGFVTVMLGRMNLGTMAASALLAASMVIVLKLRRWYWLEPVGIAATYAVHWMWLRQVFSELLDKRQFAQFGISAGLLTVYWLLFTISHFLRDDRERQQRLWLACAFLLNAAGYLTVLRYQSIYPELRFWFLLGAGAVYLGLSAYARRIQRRLAFLLASTLGAALLLVAIPYRFSDARVEYIWLLEAEAFLFIGWRLAERHLRNLGWAAAAVLAPWIVIHDLAPRFVHWEEPQIQVGVLLLGLGVAYLANARFVPRLLRAEATAVDELAAQISAPVGAGLLLAAAWVALPFLWVAVAWAASALALRGYARWMDDSALLACGHGAAFAVVPRLLMVNLSHVAGASAPNWPIWTMAAATMLLYICGWGLRAGDSPRKEESPVWQFFGRGPSAVYAWGATLPIAVLIFQAHAGRPLELTLSVFGLAVVAVLVSRPVAFGYLLVAAWLALPLLWVAPAWAALALGIGEFGRRKNWVWETCGHIGAALVVLRLTLVHLGQVPPAGAVKWHIWTIALAAALLYLSAWRIRIRERKLEEGLLQQLFGTGASAIYAWVTTVPIVLLVANEYRARPVELTLSVLGLAVVAALVSYPIALGYLMTAIWLSLPFMWVAPMWTGLAVLVHEAGLRRNSRVLRFCGHAIAALAALRLLIVNMQHAPPFAGTNLRVVTVALSAALFYALARRMAPSKSAAPPEIPLGGEWVWRGGISPFYSGAGTVLAALLIWNEVTAAAIALAWGMLGLALVEASRPIADRALRTQGYALLVLSFGRIFIADLNMVSMVGPVTARLVTVALLAAIYYYLAFAADPELPRMRTALHWFGSAAVASLLRFEMPSAWVAVAWAGLTVVLFLVGRTVKLKAYAYQAFLLTILVAMRCAFDDFYQPDTRATTVTFASLLLYLLLGVLVVEKRRAAVASKPIPPPSPAGRGRLSRWAQAIDAHPQHLFFFTPTLLLTVLLILEVRRSYLTAAWGAEGVIVFLVALLLGERAFRLFGLGLLLLCVGRLVMVDIWAFEPLGRIVSFMGLGVALLVVSFLYARNREEWHKYL